MTLTRTTQRAFPSITVASRQRSSSLSSSASPELLHLSDLSTHTVDGYSSAKLPPPTEEHGTTAPVFEPGSPLYPGNHSQTSQLQPGNLTRQEAIGGYLEEADLPSEDSRGQQDAHPQSVGSDEESPVQHSSSVSAHGAKEEAVPSTPESAAPSSHVSHVHLPLSPRTTIHSLSPLISSPHIDSDPKPAPKELLPVRPRSSASSPDEGVGLSSPPEWCRNTERVGQQDPCTLYRTSERSVVSPTPQTTEAAGSLSLEKGCRFGGCYCINSFVELYSDVCVFPLKCCRCCCLINQAAVRSCSTSLRQKLTSLTPPWRAPTQVRSASLVYLQDTFCCLTEVKCEQSLFS